MSASTCRRRDPTIDENHGSPIPEPPQRVPFGVVVTTALLGMLSLPLIIAGDGDAVLRRSPSRSTSARPRSAGLAASVGRRLRRAGRRGGLVVRPRRQHGRADGRSALLAVVAGLILLATGVAGDDTGDCCAVGLLALVLGLGVLLVPLLSHGPAYLAARQVWSRAERDWLHDLTTPVTARRRSIRSSSGRGNTRRSSSGLALRSSNIRLAWIFGSAWILAQPDLAACTFGSAWSPSSARPAGHPVQPGYSTSTASPAIPASRT